MNNFSKIRLIGKATLQTIKDNPRIILQAILFFGLMLVPIIALWGWFISQSPIEEFTELVWAFLIIVSVIWGVFISHYFEFVITRILLKYYNHNSQEGILFSKVLAYTGLSFGISTVGSILPGIFSGIYGITTPAITSLIPATILDNPNKSLKQTLQENKDMFGKIGGYAVFSQIYLSLFLIGAFILVSGILFVLGIGIFYGLDINTAITATAGLDTDWITKFWDGYLLFSLISLMVSIIILLFYRVLASIIISTSLYIWYKNGNNPEEFQKVFLEKALEGKNSEIFFT